MAEQIWYYPMDQYDQRQTVKGFGTFVDDNFYKGKETLFPYNRFYGYHAAVDLEVFGNEQNDKVPVYAVTDGTVAYIGSLQGYGGVVLEKLNSESKTALYGHVKIADLSFKVGDNIKAGQLITYLGNAFSLETSKERKHLHFGIYKGEDIYFHGHETTKKQLLSKWEDPNQFLKSKQSLLPINKDIKLGAGELMPKVTVTPATQNEDNVIKSFIGGIIKWVRNLFIFKWLNILHQ